MRPIVVRAVFVALLLATVASQIQAYYAPKADALTRLADVLKDQGLSASEPLVGKGSFRSINVAVPGCDRPVSITPMRLSLEEAPLFEAWLPAGDTARYVFIGQVWNTAEPRSVRMAWLKHKLGPLVGHPFRTRMDTVLFVGIPGNCSAADRIDWLPLWTS
jgi:hypothetical protein